MTTKLCQVIAVEKGAKNNAFRELTAAHQALAKDKLLSGISRTYRARDDEGETLPPESSTVQIRVEDVLRQLTPTLVHHFDITAMKDLTNTTTRADVVVDGIIVAAGLPVTYLLFLEKQLVSLHTLVEKLPVLDPSEIWSPNEAGNAWASQPSQTVRTKKVPRNHVKAEATNQHPAQVEVYHEDIVVGYWTTTKFSGAVPATRVAELLARIEKLQSAVKFAREEANGAEVVDIRQGQNFFDYLFA